MSPILDECDHCGLASDYHIVRCIVTRNFEAIKALVSRGATSIHDVIRCADMCATVSPYAVGVPDRVAGAVGLETATTAIGIETMVACVQKALCAAFVASAPDLANHSGIGMIVMEYWQGVNLKEPSINASLCAPGCP